jgi:hypothetical protein
LKHRASRPAPIRTQGLGVWRCRRTRGLAVRVEVFAESRAWSRVFLREPISLSAASPK